MRNNKRYLAFSSAVSQAFLEKTDLRTQFFLFTFSIACVRRFLRLTYIVYTVLNLVLNLVDLEVLNVTKAYA